MLFMASSHTKVKADMSDILFTVFYPEPGTRDLVHLLSNFSLYHSAVHRGF